MAKNKEFKAGVYSVVAGVVVAVVLVAITVYAYTARYTALDPGKVALAYVDTIAQTGDGYNAYKNSLVSKNAKYGDFIYDAYMKPYVNTDAKQAEFVGSGTEQEAQAIDRVYSEMYDYYIQLLETYGLDDYDSVFTEYFARLAQVRREVYGDEYMDRDYMFGVFESNVSSYGKSLTGTDQVLAEDEKTVVQEKSIGKYQEMYGEDYKLTSTVESVEALSNAEMQEYIAAYKQRIEPVAQSGEERAEQFGLEDKTTQKKVLFFTVDETSNDKTAMKEAFEKLDCSGSISAVSKATVNVSLADGTSVATQEVYVVRIGNSWYVDNTNIDTSGLYFSQS